MGWSVPSGSLETGETLDECCIREVKEETGYSVDTVKKLLVKEK
ncbi:mutT/NUDIX [Exiguobacterium sp. S17]|nr:mutT/NUDIX [Exiguobacterium sp. S17]